MTRQWPRFPLQAGVTCLVVLGVLLLRVGTRSGGPETYEAILLLFATLGVALAAALVPARAGVHRPRALRLITLVAAAILLATALGFLVAEPNRSETPRDQLEQLARGRDILLDLPPAMGRTALRLESLVAAAYREGEDLDGGLFRILGGVGDVWSLETGGDLPMEPGAVLWRDGERVAWSPGAAPLDLADVGRGGPVPDPPSDRRLLQGRGGWFLQQVTPLDSGLGLELQVPLTGARLTNGDRGWIPSVVAQPRTETFVDDQGRLATDLVLAGTRGGAVRLSVPGSGAAEGLIRWRSRLLLAAVMSWLVTLLGFCRLALGQAWVLAALWGGRALLADVELLRWVSGAFPDQVFPARPGSLISLVDPAYFATPFAFGWFASAADALLTTALVAGTAWWLLLRQGLVGGDEAPRDLPPRNDLWLRGLAFGLAGGLLALGLRFLAGLIAENANARLVGTGVSLSFLSFWGLQIALMLASFSLAALVTGFGGRSWPGRGRLGAWLGAVGLAMGASLAVTVTAGGLTPGGNLLAAGVVAGLWCAGGALKARPVFLRRFVWPAVILITVVWNYASLREIYDHAERSWLVRKGGLITQADQEWTRYLVGSVLEDMQEQDGAPWAADGGPEGDIWRDEAAWRLWRDSALRDLGYACLVELVDPDEMEESIFARGFLREFQYEIADRSDWLASDGQPVGAEPVAGGIFQIERRIYAGGEEEVLNAEITRQDGRGWIRVELPLRSWRIETQLESLGGGLDLTATGYRPRAEIDRPVVLLLADDTGWLAAGGTGFPGPGFDERLAALREGRREWESMRLSGGNWLCRWNPLPEGAARTSGEGFLLGLRQPGLVANLLDLSRMMLLNLALYFLLYATGEARRLLGGNAAERGRSWAPGFQERFLSGYLLLGLVLLLVVGTSVDRVGYDRVRAEARDRTLAGMSLAVEQLRSLLVEQAISLAESDYIADLLGGQLAGNRPVGPMEVRQGMVFDSTGALLLDETLSNLDEDEARALLAAGREAPMVLIREDGTLFVGTVIPLDLRGFYGVPDSITDGLGHGSETPGGFFFYRQQMDPDLIGSLADLVRGQATLQFDGVPTLASHPGPVFAGRTPLLADPGLMATLFDHPSGTGVFASADRPFAFTGTQPLPAFARDLDGRLVRRTAPGVLALDFPDREREHVVQRRATILFLAGLANLILLTALALALLLSWNIFRPLRLLSTATRSLARGDFAAPLPEEGRDEIGRLAGAFGRMRSDLQAARDKLAARERFLTTLLDRVTVGVAVIDAEGRTVTLNPTGMTILADFYPAEEAETALDRLVGDFDKHSFGAPGPDGETRTGEFRSPDGRRTVRGARAPLVLGDDRVDVMLVFEDITEFLATKKMAINAELARQVAHEIKNPLTPIQLSVQLLDQARRDGHPDLDRIMGDTVARVLDQVTLLRSIAGEFSLLGRPDDVETVPIDLRELVTEVAAGYGAPTAGSEGDLEATGDQVPRVRIADAVLPAVAAHRDSLQKILGNLMQNSLDAARPGWPVTVEVEWRVEPDFVTMVWADDGTGLPAEVADRLFDPYFSTKSKGTGLGLAICRNLADRMGGRITLANRDDGAGARAELTMRRAEDGEDV